MKKTVKRKVCCKRIPGCHGQFLYPFLTSEVIFIITSAVLTLHKSLMDRSQSLCHFQEVHHGKKFPESGL